MLRSYLRDFSEAYIVVKGNIAVLLFSANDFEATNNTVANATAINAANDNEFGEKSWFLKKMHHLLAVFQTLFVYQMTTQKI